MMQEGCRFLAPPLLSSSGDSPCPSKPDKSPALPSGADLPPSTEAVNVQPSNATDDSACSSHDITEANEINDTFIPPSTTELHTETLQDLQSCVLSAGRLVSSASTALTNITDDTDFRSDYGDFFSYDQSSQVRDWISHSSVNTIANFDIGEPSRRRLSNPSTAVEKGPEVFVSDLDSELAQNLYQLGRKQFEAADYAAAEQFVTRCLTLCQKNPHVMKAEEEQRAFDMLLSTYIKQDKLQEAELFLRTQITITASEDVRLFHLLHSLAHVYLLIENFEDAEKECQRAAKGYMQLLGKEDERFLRSIELLTVILERSGDSITAESYRAMFFAGSVVRNGMAWEEAIQELRKNGYDLTRMFDKNKANALRWASEKGHLNVVKVLIQENEGIGKVVNRKDSIGKTALHYASTWGHSDIVKLLLQNGADPDVQAACTMSSIHLAAYYGEAAVVRELLDGGAQIDKVTEEKQTALHCAVDGGHAEVVKLLLERGANINKTDGKGQSALHSACYRQRLDVLKALLMHNPEVSLQDRSDWTALHVAASNGFDEAITLLINHGANTFATNNAYHTPLMVAVRCGTPSTVHIFLERGASLKAFDKEGNTPLHHAIERGNLEMVKLLHRAGADLFAKNSLGDNAFDLARDLMKKHIEVYLRTLVRPRT